LTAFLSSSVRFVRSTPKSAAPYHGANDHIGVENLHVAFRTLRHLKELLVKVKIENEGIAGDGAYGAYIDEILDVHSEAVNSVLTLGNMVHITRHKIWVEGKTPEIGVWFVSQADSARVKITGHLGINRTTELEGAPLPFIREATRLPKESQ
jgi:hypothetical protein